MRNDERPFCLAFSLVAVAAILREAVTSFFFVSSGVATTAFGTGLGAGGAEGVGKHIIYPLPF
jgi:hypothetical protein